MDQSLKQFINISPPPPSFDEKTNSHYVWKLDKALYGLKKTSRARNARFSHYLKGMSFTSKFNESLFVYKKCMNFSYLLPYPT